MKRKAIAKKSTLSQADLVFRASKAERVKKLVEITLLKASTRTSISNDDFYDIKTRCGSVTSMLDVVSGAAFLRPSVDVVKLKEVLRSSVSQSTSLLMGYSQMMHEFMRRAPSTLSAKTLLCFYSQNFFKKSLALFGGAKDKGVHVKNLLPGDDDTPDEIGDDASKSQSKLAAEKNARKLTRDSIMVESIKLFIDIIQEHERQHGFTLTCADHQMFGYMAKTVRANYINYNQTAIPAHVASFLSSKFDISRKQATLLTVRLLDPLIEAFKKSRKFNGDDDEPGDESQIQATSAEEEVPECHDPEAKTQHADMLSRVPDAENWLTAIMTEHPSLVAVNLAVLETIDREPRQDLFQRFHLFPQYTSESKFITIDNAVITSWANAGKLGDNWTRAGLLRFHGCNNGKATAEVNSMLKTAHMELFRVLQTAALHPEWVKHMNGQNEKHCARDADDTKPWQMPSTFMTNGVETRVGILRAKPICHAQEHDHTEANQAQTAIARLACAKNRGGFESIKAVNAARSRVAETFPLVPDRGLFALEQFTSIAIKTELPTLRAADPGHGDLFYCHDGHRETLANWRSESGIDARKASAVLRNDIVLDTAAHATVNTIARAHAEVPLCTADRVKIHAALHLRNGTTNVLLRHKAMKWAASDRFLARRRHQSALDSMANRLFNMGKGSKDSSRKVLCVGNASFKSTFKGSGSAPVVACTNFLAKKNAVISFIEHNTSCKHVCGKKMEKVLKDVPRFKCITCKYRFNKKDKTSLSCPANHPRGVQKIHDYKFFRCVGCDEVVHRDKNAADNDKLIIDAKAHGLPRPVHL